jgi:hypothetical protein
MVAARVAHGFFVSARSRASSLADVELRASSTSARGTGTGAVTDAVVFDMDGVLIDSEQVWDDVRERLAAERGRPLARRAQAGHDGYELAEWSRYMHEKIGLAESARGDQRRGRAPDARAVSHGPPGCPGAARGG